MEASDKPESFGVFKPVGHVIVAFPSAQAARDAAAALANAGFASADVLSYSPEQMIRQADIDIDQAGVLASLGQELNLVKAHRELAEKGHSFLVVNAPADDKAWQVADISRGFGAVRAQKYGRFIIEELIEPGEGQAQVGESSDRGLDAQTLSGNEAPAGASSSTASASGSSIEGGVSTEQVSGR